MSFRSILHSMLSQRLANLSALSTLRGRLAIVALSSVITHGALASDIVRVDTDSGSFVLEMYADTAPVTVANFLSYVNSGAYEDTIIHRKVNNFVIQGGGFYYDPASSDIAAISVGPTIVNEFSRSNTRGTIAMAKLGGDPNSATSQWFVNLGDNSANLDSQKRKSDMSFRSILHSMLSQRLANLSALSTLRGRLAIVALSSVITHGALASDIVRVDTDSGSFVLEMYADTAPVTVANFLSYVNSGAYEDTIIHRKVNNFVIQGGGFTVFGKVLGTGMTAADAIGALRTVNITGAMSFSDVPYLSLTGTTIADADFVNVSMSALSTSAKFGSGKLSVALNAGAIGQAWVDFAITQSSPDTVITLVPSSTLFIDRTLEDMATFDAFSGTLLIPALEINGAVAYTNLRFTLTDAKNYSFTLQSFDEAP